MREGIDAEGALLDDEGPQDAGVEETAPVVVPAEAAEESGNDEGNGQGDGDIVVVLEEHDGVRDEVGDVGSSQGRRVLLYKQPADVRVQEAFADGVWIFRGVGVSMVSSVVRRPGED